MADLVDREHYIPIRKSDLIRLLATDVGMEPASADQFRRFCEILTATFHFQYYELLEEIKDNYAPFDPEAVTAAVAIDPPEVRESKLEELFRRFDELMRKANFKELGLEDLKKALDKASDVGINMDVDLSIFERLRVYVRGEGKVQRFVRRIWTYWRRQEVMLDLYLRFVIIVKMNPTARVPQEVDTADVFLKFFRDIPKDDLEMMLPGARVMMPFSQRLKMGGSVLSGLAILGYNIAKQLFTVAVVGATYLYGFIFALIGYGWRQYAGYQNTRNIYNLRLTQSLYYQNLANNAGVIACLIDEAEEQDCREAILAYYYLWRFATPEGWTAAELDDRIEQELERLANLKVDFEVEDALEKLVRMKLATQSGDRYHAVPMDQALETLDETWDNIFTYHNEVERVTAA
ncbi:MAG: DUF3754 domain-containing protein [Gemmataceae bacterium]|nr:DUF3754 domain-containing protein [Gemmataceae bacterium]